MRVDQINDYSHTEIFPVDDSPGYQPSQLVLVGAGHAHVQLLAHWAKQPILNVRITLVAPHPQQIYAGMVSAVIAGHSVLEQSMIALEPLVRNSGVRWLTRSLRSLDAQNQQLHLDDGSVLDYDWLSVNTGAVQSRSLLEKTLPGVREHGLFVRPVENFMSLWSKVVEMGHQRALRIAVIGAGTAGIELAMATRHRLPNAAITLLSAQAFPGAQYSAKAQQMLLKAIRQRRITVIQEAAVRITDQEVVLASGARLACDVPLIAIGSHPASWLATSTLALDEAGFIAVDGFQRSTSHANIFAVGDASSRQDRFLPRNATHAMRVGPNLAYNLAAAVQSRPMRQHQPSAQAWQLIFCGDGDAIAVGRWFCFQGRWVGWLKQWLDRQWVGRFRVLARAKARASVPLSASSAVGSTATPAAQ
jgi:NADH dehydrogenase FAD-containing subunit